MTWWCRTCLRLSTLPGLCWCGETAPLLDLTAPSDRDRVRVRRAHGRPLPRTVKCVDRASRFGNPYVVGTPAPNRRFLLTPTDAEALFVTMLRTNPRAPRDWTGKPYPSVAQIRDTLVAWDLACWCAAEDPCHVTSLLRIAAGGDP